jgi:hypothetical protein
MLPHKMNCISKLKSFFNSKIFRSKSRKCLGWALVGSAAIGDIAASYLLPLAKANSNK